MPILTVMSVVSSTYVRDLSASRAFYGALCFTETSAGSNELSAWSYLHHGEHAILLVTSTPPVDIPELPLLFYFYVDDLAVAMGLLQNAGIEVTHLGCPVHALGGEAKTVDPDGNTVLLGQRHPRENQPPVEQDHPGRHFSLLREAAALARSRGSAEISCQIGDDEGGSCDRPADVKLADGWGSSVWACLQHAGVVLVAAPASFIAKQDSRQGLDQFLARRRTR